MSNGGFDSIHKKLLEETASEIRNYKQALRDFEMEVSDYKKRKLKHFPEEPEPPKRQALFIPANNSSAMIIQQLKQSGGWGVLCESEADTLGNVLKQDWGGYSDLLRKVFHFETVSYSRKGGNEFFEIESPRLSVAISGTPNQVMGLIPSIEDGLFSRFIFYLFNVKPHWKKHSQLQNRKVLTHHFLELSEKVNQMLEWLDQYPTEVELNFEQWVFFDEVFGRIFLETHALDGEELLSTIKRLGVIMFRIIMVLSVIRKYESKQTVSKMICHDDDFHMAITLVETYWRHSIFLFEKLPDKKQVKYREVPNLKKVFFEKLPSEFKRVEAGKIGLEMQVSERTVTRYLKRWIALKLLEQPRRGVYIKT
jgi:hypothetical protein